MTFLKSVAAAAMLIVLGISIWLDFAFGIYTNWTFLLTMVGVVVALTFWLTLTKRLKTKILAMASAAAMVLSIRYWDYDSQKPFMRALDNLEKGMTKQEVIAKMSRYKLVGQGKGFISVSEKEQQPDIDKRVDFLNFTHTEEAWGDSDWGIVYFVNNRLYKTEFSHD